MAPKGKAPAASKQKGKKLFDLSSLIKKSSTVTSSGGSRSSPMKPSKATFALVAAVFQKGDKKGELTGSIYMRAKPRYGKNEEFKTTCEKDLLNEKLRWNDELKVYTAKVHTPAQAQLILDAMRTIDEKHEEDLADETIDESVFEEANDVQIVAFPMTVHEGATSQDEECLAFGGSTYPFKEELKARGFVFKSTVNGNEGVQLWLKPLAETETDKAEIFALMNKYGFRVDEHDGVQPQEGAASSTSGQFDD